MDETILDNINSLVQPNDELFHLGDFSFRFPELYLDRIKCKNIHLILGNHDKLSKVEKEMFASWTTLREIKYRGNTFVLCHYAMRVWNKSHHGSFHLYGHSHGSLPDPGNKSFDCGVDCWGFKPISGDFVIDYMKDRPIHAVDHHTGSTPI